MTALYVPAGGDYPTAAELATLDPLYAEKAADQSLSTITYTNDSNLFVPVTANAKYHYELKILIRANNATNGGMKVQFTIPAGASMPWTMFRWGGNASPLLTGTNGQVTGLTLTTSNQFYEEEGVLTVAGTGGNFQFQWAQNGGPTNNAIVAAFSFLHLRQVA